MGDTTRGIYRKFEITRTDGSSGPGGKHQNCAYFVLDLEHDEFAIAALRAYAKACRKSHPLLADDIDRIASTGRFATKSPNEQALLLMLTSKGPSDAELNEMARVRAVPADAETQRWIKALIDMRGPSAIACATHLAALARAYAAQSAELAEWRKLTGCATPRQACDEALKSDAELLEVKSAWEASTEAARVEREGYFESLRAASVALDKSISAHVATRRELAELHGALGSVMRAANQGDRMISYADKKPNYAASYDYVRQAIRLYLSTLVRASKAGTDAKG